MERNLVLSSLFTNTSIAPRAVANPAKSVSANAGKNVSRLNASTLYSSLEFSFQTLHKFGDIIVKGLKILLMLYFISQNF